MTQRKTVITLMGRTGDGKSTLANKLARLLANNEDISPFEEGGGASSQTHASKAVTMNDVIIVDNPGLMDSLGSAQDDINMRSIVSNAKELGYLNILVLVLNAQVARFDNGIQCVLKLISDVFGRGCLNHLYIVYTHRHSVSNRTLETRTAQILEIINRRCEVSLTHLTHYAIENCPEELDDINEDRIATIRAQTRGQLTHLVNVARATENYSTANAVTVEEAKAKERNLSDQQGKAEIVKQNGKKEKDQSSWRTPGREWWKHPLRFVGGGIQGGIFASVGSFMAATVVFLAFTAAPEIMIPVAGAIKAAGGLTVIASSVAGAGAVVGGTLAVCAEDVEAPSMLIQYLSEDKK